MTKKIFLESRLRKAVSVGGLILILLANAYFLSKSAFNTFIFYDWGGFLDASWRVFTGQKPYVDFYYTTGPIHLYMNAAFFKLFGFGKSAILAHIIVVSSGVTIATFLAVRRQLPLLGVLLISFLAASGFYIALPHPWYIHSAHFFGILGFALLLAKLPLSSDKSAFQCAVACGMLALFSFMTKTDVGAANGLVFFVIFLMSPYRLKAVGGYLLGLLIGCILISFIISPVSYYENAVTNYGVGAMRQLGRFLYLPTLLKNYYWLPAIAVPFALGPLKNKHRELLALFLGIGFSGLFTLNIGSLRGSEHIPVMAVYLGAAFVLMVRIKDADKTRKQNIVYGMCVIILVSCTALQIKRSTAKGIDFYKSQATSFTNRFKQGDYVLKAKAFAGWQFDQESGQMLDDMVDFVNQNIGKDESFLILTKMQILYPLTERDSFRNVPFIWHPGQLPAPGPQREKVRDYLKNNPPDWILTEKEEEFPINRLVIYLEIGSELIRKYQLVKSWDNYLMLRKK